MFISRQLRAMRVAPLAIALGAVSAPMGAQQALLDKVQVHGYLNQGVGASDSLPLLGLGKSATADYRTAALQFRLAATPNDIAVVQVSNRRVGASALNGLEDAVTLQWAYYQRRLPGAVRLKLGRAPMPRGIYNEVRKVGSVLPFFRAPIRFYTESYETVDGAMLSRTTSVGPWEIETSAFGGSSR